VHPVVHQADNFFYAHKQPTTSDNGFLKKINHISCWRFKSTATGATVNALKLLVEQLACKNLVTRCWQ